MTLTEQWEKGELEALDKLIKQIEAIDNNRALSDEYLKNNGQCTREDYNIVGEWGYGIVWVIVDYVLPYLRELRAKEQENQHLKDLLKECKYFLYEYDNDFSWDDCVKSYHLRETIGKIIGEKK